MSPLPTVCTILRLGAVYRSYKRSCLDNSYDYNSIVTICLRLPACITEKCAINFNRYLCLTWQPEVAKQREAPLMVMSPVPICHHACRPFR
jgi:hypothetical protein